MNPSPLTLRHDARAIWQAAVDAARPETLLRDALAWLPLVGVRRLLVVGAGKAGVAMSAAVEAALPQVLERMEGIVNVPAGAVRPLRRIRLHAARPDASNQPTEAGVAGTRQALELLGTAGPEDVALCLLSGGGSALLPAPAEGITLADKQTVTQMLHECGATINEMNCVRKHLSAVKGGRLAQAFKGRALYSLILSDVIGDPLDVIASGPTAADPTTFADALAVLERYQLAERVPARVLARFRDGMAGRVPETLKALPSNIHNLVIGNNARSLAAAEAKAKALGYGVLDLGSYIEGETRQVAVTLAGVLRSVSEQQVPLAAPACLLSGGETTVTLSPNHGRGGRNQEFVLAALLKLGDEGLKHALVLSGGTDGEDGPTDAAGALADAETLRRARQLHLDAADHLRRHDAYSFFDATGDLIRSGLTQTNVMDVRVMLVAPG